MKNSTLFLFAFLSLQLISWIPRRLCQVLEICHRCANGKTHVFNIEEREDITRLLEDLDQHTERTNFQVTISDMELMGADLINFMFAMSYFDSTLGKTSKHDLVGYSCINIMALNRAIEFKKYPLFVKILMRSLEKKPALQS